MRLGGGLLKLKNGKLPFQVGLGVTVTRQSEREAESD